MQVSVTTYNFTTLRNLNLFEFLTTEITEKTQRTTEILQISDGSYNIEKITSYVKEKIC
ncbi:MAG: hypothetical protein GY795_51220 [Desulfobacterales bacterium]|nr:hypothetical protein [Desulfobacterales bacterium]